MNGYAPSDAVLPPTTACSGAGKAVIAAREESAIAAAASGDRERQRAASAGVDMAPSKRDPSGSVFFRGSSIVAGRRSGCAARAGGLTRTTDGVGPPMVMDTRVVKRI